MKAQLGESTLQVYVTYSLDATTQFEGKIEFSLMNTWIEDQGDLPGWHRNRNRNPEHFEETSTEENRTLDQLPLHVGCLHIEAVLRRPGIDSFFSRT